MTAKTTTRVVDRKGVKLVVGQSVYVEESNMVGQLMGVTEQEGVCLVRLAGTGQVVSVPSKLVTIASWEQVRKGGSQGDSSKTTLF
ncbi:hypothetical protein EDM80_07115 [bacterium]|nr:MAG: hypothetical protein EDM80_07115 [bacterium]RIK65390.1 MAG: hypothetical protein DCC64_01760 [Planctomycetota bacterium]